MNLNHRLASGFPPVFPSEKNRPTDNFCLYRRGTVCKGHEKRVGLTPLVTEMTPDRAMLNIIKTTVLTEVVSFGNCSM